MNHARLGSLCLATWILLAGQLAGASDRPNVIFILTDNHGAWRPN